MTNHRMRDELDTALGGLYLLPLNAGAGPRPVRDGGGPARAPLRLTRRAAVVLAVCALLTAAALAVGPTPLGHCPGGFGPESPLRHRGSGLLRGPGASASRPWPHWRTASDPALLHHAGLNRGPAQGGHRLGPDALPGHGDGFSWGNGGKGEQVLSYDSETKTAAMVFSRGTDELSTDIPPGPNWT